MWEDLLKIVRAGDTAGAVRFVGGLGDAGRKAVAAELPGYVAARSRSMDGPWQWQRELAPLVVAGVGCLGGAAAVTAWVFRRDFRWRTEDAGEPRRILDLVRDRPAPWREDLARRMTARLRVTDGDREWQIVAALVRDTGIEPPASDELVLGWLRGLHTVEVAADPLFPHLAPRIFEPPGLAEAFGPWQAETVAALVESGLLERAAVLDGVVGRLLRDGPAGPPALAGLHDSLAPTLDETAERVRDYAALLPVAPPAVAALARARLRLLDDAGRLGDELFAEAIGGLAFRTEKELVKAAVTWADEAMTRAPGRAGAALGALAPIFKQDALDLQGRAVRAAVKHAAHAGAEGRAAVLEAAGALPADLRAQISAAYDATVEEELPETPALVAGPAPELPAAIASAGELAREVADVDWRLGPWGFERVLAALAEWTGRDRPALREALGERWRAHVPEYFGHRGRLRYEGIPETLRRAVLAAVAPEASRELSAALAATEVQAPARDAFERLFQRRALELVAPFESGARYPVLLATPTSGTGHVDPATLLDRLQRLADAGAEPLPADLEQALLRLPRDVAPAVLARARALTTDAGRACAAWMGGAIPGDPEMRCEVETRVSYGSVYTKVTTTLTPPGETVPESLRGLFGIDDGHDRLGWRALVLPSHRDVVAAHLAPHLAVWLDSTHDPQVTLLAGLPHAGGPVGTGMAYALTFVMGHSAAADRAVAVDALITLAARDQVPAAALGAAVAHLVRSEVVKLNRVIAALDEVTLSGGHAAVWAVIAATLPRLLPADGARPRAGLPDLLAAGARAARACKAGGAGTAGSPGGIPELAALAARKGTTRFVQEARRLHQVLTG
ncbi:DUF7824 domain-containing protein [Nonomuraea sp. SBT364]|uniref:DUF7824 domain-containing protein n=1 Tax=Nonomuraea sp. SBT364 TaxID=1580530 RepID=UPI00066A49B5|nr:DUF6493 family protein [Nonomuraea sp. SBT364]